MKESPYAKWVREEREAWEANCSRQDFAPTEDYWRMWLEVKAFSLIEQAQTLLEAALDLDEESAGARDAAIDRIITHANYLRIGPVYTTVEWEGDPTAYGEAIDARLEELRTMPYSDFLASPEWRLQRAATLRRAGGRCQACNKEKKLYVHHRTYERRGDEAADDLLALCFECHAAVHWHGGAHRPQGSS